MGMPLSKASKGGFIGNGWGIRRLHPQGNLLWNVMAVPHRLEVLLEAFPKDIPMPVGSNFLGSLGNFRHFSSLETSPDSCKKYYQKWVQIIVEWPPDWIKCV
jgi:hypothetical protein